MTDADSTQWDVIVIGSGMGGMTAAAALSKGGHKVLLLEQYETLGGLSHSFSIEGFSWDAGIHYLNCVAPDDREHRILDWLSVAPIEFVSMGSVYDNLHIGDAAPLALSRPYEAQARDLKDRFPDEAEAIDAWIAALSDAGIPTSPGICSANHSASGTRARASSARSGCGRSIRDSVMRCTRPRPQVLGHLQPPDVAQMHLVGSVGQP